MLKTNLNKLRGLSHWERRLLFESALLLPLVHAGLLVLGYSRLRGIIEKWTQLKHGETPVAEGEQLQRGCEIARIVSIAAEHGFYRATCLRRSLLTWWFLRRAGMQSTICFGVWISGGTLEGHAWVEHNGVIINDSPRICALYQSLYHALPATELGL